MQIKIVSIALTSLLIKLDNIKINRFHLNTVGGKGGGGLIIRCSSFFLLLFSGRIWAYNCGGVILSGEFIQSRKRTFLKGVFWNNVSRTG